MKTRSNIIYLALVWGILALIGVCAFFIAEKALLIAACTCGGILLSFIIVRLNIKNKQAYNFMNHEISEPLNAIIELGQLELKNKRLPHNSKISIERILISSKNLFKIISDFLDLNEVERGKLEIVPINEETANLTGASVLIVDDVAMNLEIARRALNQYNNLHVETVNNGQKAIDLIKAGKKYDVIFMDHMMPGMDGIEATKIIREMGGYYAKNVPIIAFTANAMAGNSEMFLDKGLDDFISKPLDVAKLDACLNKWIKKRVVEHSEINSETIQYHIDVNEGIAQFGSEAMFNKILASFKKHTPKLLEDLQEKTDRDYIIAIHSLKGCVKTIFANELGERALKLEMAAKEGRWEFVKNKNKGLVEDIERLIKAISVD